MNESTHISLFDIIAILISLSALFSYINHRYIRLPTTIGLMLIALLMSLGIVGLDALGLGLADNIKSLMDHIDFNTTLMHGMLSFLLFAGALHVNLNDLANNKWIIGFLATVGVCLSTLIIAFTGQWVLAKIGIDLSLIYCLLFGALISPTDPIAVLGILKTAGASKSLETKIGGESLFNDGIGVVIFIVLLGIASGGAEISTSSIALLFAQEAIGGIVFGLVIGGIAYGLLKSIDNYQVEILITLAVVCGGYSLAHVLHLSGPIAVVVAGLLIGNHGRLLAMSDKTREHLDLFWELVDEILNAVLFVMIGLEVLVLTFDMHYLAAGLFLIPVVLLARFISVGVPVTILRLRRDFSNNAIKIMTWGGLRGGISVALALSLPAGRERDIILVATYTIVVFSILVQGLTIGRLIRSSKQ
jgi:CPA1 family monovalent cation:H+ antiporter